MKADCEIVRRRGGVLLMAAALAAALGARADEPAAQERFTVRQDAPSTGSQIKRAVVRNIAVPPEKAYGELTPDQKSAVHAGYESLAPGDEPPYPLYGVGRLFKAISDGADKLTPSGFSTPLGRLALVVDIDAKGQATSVSVLEAPTIELAKFAASVLMLEPYKAAICTGRPCAMQYPFVLTFTRN